MAFIVVYDNNLQIYICKNNPRNNPGIIIQHSILGKFYCFSFESGRLNPIGWPTLRACGTLIDSAAIA